MKFMITSAALTLGMLLGVYANAHGARTERWGDYDTYCEFNDRLVHTKFFGFGRDRDEAMRNAWEMCRDNMGEAEGNAHYCDYTYFYPTAGEWRCEERHDDKGGKGGKGGKGHDQDRD